jgi:hypothetical protein
MADHNAAKFSPQRLETRTYQFLQTQGCRLVQQCYFVLWTALFVLVLGLALLSKVDARTSCRLGDEIGRERS